MSWWFAVPAVLQGISAITQANSASKQNQSQYATNMYNAQMGYSQAKENSMNQMMIAGMNYGMASGAAKLNLKLAEFNADIIKMSTDFNIKVLESSSIHNGAIIEATTGYNNSLLDTEIADLWESMDLDIAHLQNQRAREQGQIVAIQSASGTVIGEGSNADVVIDQKAQAALDELVVRHGANREVEQVRNQQAKNTWEGQMAINNLMWEGQLQKASMQYEGMMGQMSTLAGGMVNYANQMAGAAANYGSSMIGAYAGLQSAGNQYGADVYNAGQAFNQNKTGIRSNMLSGLYGAIGTGVSGYFQFKQPKSQTTPTSQLGPSYGARFPGAGRTSEGYSYMRPPTISDPGGSLFGTSGK